jgi:hypothetical protein
MAYWNPCPKRGLAAVLALLTLAACETGPAYKPRGPNDSVGYTDQQLTANRFRVTFSGNSGIKRTEVEDYLMRRAAEVTIGAGFEYFTFDSRDTESKTYYRTTFEDWDPVLGPRYPFAFGGRFGYRPYYWSNWDFPPYLSTAQSVPITRYEAYSEIVLLTPQQAMGNPQAIPAREVLSHLVPPPDPAKPPA